MNVHPDIARVLQHLSFTEAAARRKQCILQSHSRWCTTTMTDKVAIHATDASPERTAARSDIPDLSPPLPQQACRFIPALDAYEHGMCHQQSHKQLHDSSSAASKVLKGNDVCIRPLA